MSEERKLATIRKIIELSSIENADNILLATIDGWKCVVKKDEFKVGDLCVYFEIDSVVDITNKTFEFMKETKGRVKIRKFRGQFSSGLIMPLDVLKKKHNLGDDVTAELNVEKYIPPAERVVYERETKRKHSRFYKFFMKFKWFRDWQKKRLLKQAGSGFPTWIRKTDEVRVQNEPEKYKELIETNDYYVTEKIDGSSITIWMKRKGKKFDFGICSRNRGLNLKHSGVNDTIFIKTVESLNIKPILQKLLQESPLNNNIVLQGELWGVALTKNKYGKSEQYISFFNLLINGIRQNRLTTLSSFKDYKDLLLVPTLDVKLTGDIEEDLKIVNNYKSTIDSKSNIEGFVIRNNLETTWSYKLLSQTYMLKNGD
ncbi:MAG: hypothetical protein LBM99_03450 [Bacillales bacterium]|jgi:hypothetical protein|nr:hypothetical protein [Bacillales bacterium]